MTSLEYIAGIWISLLVYFSSGGIKFFWIKFEIVY